MTFYNYFQDISTTLMLLNQVSRYKLVLRFLKESGADRGTEYRTLRTVRVGGKIKLWDV